MKSAFVLASLFAVPALAGPHAASDEPTAADVADAPAPGEESGRTDEPDDGDSTLRNIGQGALLVPRVALEAAMAPVRTGIYLYDRYSLRNRFVGTFFDDTETYGLYPTLYIDSQYGVTIGGRLVHRNLFGAHERLALRAGIGGEFRQLVTSRVRSGDRFGSHFALEADAELERRPQDPFYGIGNADGRLEVRHRQELVRATTTADFRPAGALHLRLAGALTDIDYARSDEGPPIDEAYDPRMITGWTGTRNVYGELELRWDDRHHDRPFDQHAVFGDGVLLAAFAGRVHQLQAGGDYWRYGGVAQHFLPIYGARTLATRVQVEAVTGSLDDVAFTQLPQLGGTRLLRGYPAERFRDRASMLASAEYFWDLNRLLMASLFVDAGRVYPSFDSLEVDHMRLGFGASLQLHQRRSFVSSVNIASSIDGGVFFSLAFDPVFEPEPRVARK